MAPERASMAPDGAPVAPAEPPWPPRSPRATPAPPRPVPQEMCKAATDLLRPGSPSPPAEPRRGPSSGECGLGGGFWRGGVCVEVRSAPPGGSAPPWAPPAASRMIANSLSRESPPRPRPHGSKISVTVSNKAPAAAAGRTRQWGEPGQGRGASPPLPHTAP